MGISVSKNRVVVGGDDLDIYAAGELQRVLLELFRQEKKKVVLDMTGVERISSPGIQVILSAQRTFQDFQVEALGEAPAADLEKAGIRLS